MARHRLLDAAHPTRNRINQVFRLRCSHRSESAQPLLSVHRKRAGLERNIIMYFIMLCWAAVIILLSIAFMRRLW